MASPKIWKVVILAGLALAACSSLGPEQPTPTSTPAPSATAAASATSAPTATSLPTETLIPSATVPPTPSASPAPSASPTPTIAFDQLQVTGVENRLGGWLVSFTLPGVDRSLKLILGGNTYECTFDSQYPDRLFCQGLSKPAYDQQLGFAFSDLQTGDLLYQGNVVLPTALLVPPTPVGWAGNDCPQRGQNVSCETECRIAPDGNPCIVATCTDACGPYFSVHTCPDMSLDFNSCNPEQWAALKKQYQIP